MMAKINWTDRVRKEEVRALGSVKDGKQKGQVTGLVTSRNCILKHVIEGQMETTIEVMGRRRRRRQQVLDDLKVGRGYCKLKEEALDRTACGTRFGKR
jgi:metal-sulfur cluster biosynthetic enzyme